MATKIDNKQPLKLVLIGNGSGSPFIGVHELPGRLPQLLRFPGETAEAFCQRALHQAKGTGTLSALLMYPNEEATACKH